MCSHPDNARAYEDSHSKKEIKGSKIVESTIVAGVGRKSPFFDQHHVGNVRGV